MVSSDDAGRLLGVVRKTVIEWAQEGLLKYTLVGKRGIYRFSIEDLKQFAEGSTPPRYFNHDLAIKLNDLPR